MVYISCFYSLVCYGISVELAYIADDTQPKPANGLDNLFLSSEAAVMSEDGVVSTAVPKSATPTDTNELKSMEKVKHIIKGAVQEATDIDKRSEKSTQKLTLPIMLLLLLPSVLYYGISHRHASAVCSCLCAIYVLNYILKMHLGMSVIRTSNNEMGQLANGCMVVRFPVILDKLRRYLQSKREESGLEITFKHIAVKSIALALKEHDDMHGHVIFGEFFKSKLSGVDISVTTDVTNTESATIKVLDTNLKGVDFIADELAKRGEALKEEPSLMYSRKARLLSLFPHMTRCYIESFLYILGAQLGLSIPALGVVAFPLGAATLVTSPTQDTRDNLDADTDMAMVPIMGGYSSAPITVTIGGKTLLTALSAENGVRGVEALVISVTVDSKVGTLVEMRRLCTTIQNYMNNPSMLDKADRKQDNQIQDKKLAEEKAIKHASKYKVTK